MTLRSDRAGVGLGLPRRVGWLVAVLATMAVLTAGWPLVSLAVSDNQPVAPGKPLAVGRDSAHSALFTLGLGWVIRSAETDPSQDWTLRQGPVDMSVTNATLVSPSQVGQLWPGLANILRLDDPSARLGEPAVLISPQGGKGLAGTVTESGRAGEAAIFPSPTEDFAIEIVSVAPVKDSPTARAATVQVVRSLRFPTAAR